jgi:hypothetical protein
MIVRDPAAAAVVDAGGRALLHAGCWLHQSVLHGARSKL